MINAIIMLIEIIVGTNPSQTKLYAIVLNIGTQVKVFQGFMCPLRRVRQVQAQEANFT